MNHFRSIHLLVFLLFSITSSVSLFGQTKDYQQIIFYGQSLSLGWQAPRAITTTALEGNYMLGSHVNTYYSSNGTVLNPLKSIKTGPVGEQPIVSCVNVFSEAYRAAVNSDQKFIAFAGGWGGQSVEKLSKESTNDVNYYNTTFLQYLENTLTAINGQTVNCPAIVYMQGEHNSSSGRVNGIGLTPGSNATLDKAEYKDLLLKLKNNMQADIMSKYNQTEKPLFFVYQTSGGYITLQDMPVVMAQIEFSEENSDVILLNPHYAMPDYSNGHLSTNGYRWYGELISKSLICELIENKAAETLKPLSFNVDEQKITIDYEVPVPPLVLDTWTTPLQSNYGFKVYKNGSEVEISTVVVKNNTQLEITCNVSLTGKIEIVYAGNTTKGSGNLRDSDNTKISMYTYYNDSTDSLQESYSPTTENGSSMFNQHYGLQNWSNMFYYDLNPLVDITIGEVFVSDNFEYKITSILPNEVEVNGFSGTPTKTITIPESVTDTNDSKNYTVTAVALGAFSGNTNSNKGDGDTTNAIIETVVLPNSVVTLGDHSFRDTNVTTINLDNVTSIGSNSFASCSKLVDLGSLLSLESLGAYAFYACNSLITFVLPESLTVYETGQVYSLAGITSFNIPSSVTAIGALFLGRNDNLTEVQANWMNPSTDVTIDPTNFFRDLYEGDGSIKNTITLYVPVGTKTLYEAHSLWGLFPNENIIERDNLGYDEIDNKLEVSFYPNPVSSLLNIKLKTSSTMDIELYNILGQKILLKQTRNEAVVDFSLFNSGTYFVKVYVGGNIYTKKIVKL